MPNQNRFAPGSRSTYGGVVVERDKPDQVRVVPTICGRCGGRGALGTEIFCPVCKGACYVDPRDAYEPYYADDASAIHRSLLPANRSYADRSRHPAHPPAQKTASGVRVRSAGRTRK